MSTLNEIVRQAGGAYRAQYGARLLPSHRATLDALAACRTERLGGHVFTCATCATTRYSYHSCKNRHCPTCGQKEAQAWLERQQELLLPVPYFLVTFTLPPVLRELARHHQRVMYRLLFQSSAAALQHLARDDRFVGGQIGMLGVLQTWTRDLRFHPHVHYLVPAIGLARDGTLRRPRNPAYLVPAKALAVLYRAKLRAALARTALRHAVPTTTWQQSWVVDCRAVGSGATALKYLAPYMFRVALSNNRIVSMQDGRVTFRYRDGATKQMRLCTLTTAAFLGRFLQHVVPKGFVKVRLYGLFSPRQRAQLRHVREQLGQTEREAPEMHAAAHQPPVAAAAPEMLCPVCGQVMQRTLLRPIYSRGPPVQEWRRTRNVERVKQQTAGSLSARVPNAIEEQKRSV